MPEATAMTSRVDVARAALSEITPDAQVGDLTSETTDADGVTTLTFAATMLGYPGWHWTVSVAQLDGEEPTVLEAELLPGEGALIAPDWVPWSVRLEEYKAAQAAEAAARKAAGESDDDEHGGEHDDDDDAFDDDDEESDADDADDDDFDDHDDEHGEDFGDDVYDGLDPEAAAQHVDDRDDDADEDADESDPEDE
ncbi:DUF3027 domain-containing protein [Schumannella soli]|uniref:DUF3027 domain-containing protein n=1 Tax=Schumannella soli TaxID=2590779 RepID=A0A506Y293_9MICO|nr:DUF3027 domain-containing protein [Schumannella soli]TPW75567.1 DUF3027 domain-containing protein [Schumannella soli]